MLKVHIKQGKVCSEKGPASKTSWGLNIQCFRGQIGCDLTPSSETQSSETSTIQSVGAPGLPGGQIFFSFLFFFIKYFGFFIRKDLDSHKCFFFLSIQFIYLF